MVGIYIHIPFCRAKCIYCDFLSFAGRYGECAPYVSALLKELDARAAELSGRAVDTVFIGGGTPTSIPTADLVLIVKAVYEKFNVISGAEFTSEANPATVSREQLKELREAGVNRLSMGFQSLDDNVLKFLGRVHDSKEAVSAFYDARLAGFTNINVDLIFGMPFDDREAFRASLKKVLLLAPEHISAYSLIVEEGTPLCEKIDSGSLPFPDDNFDREDYAFLRDTLKKSGYVQYEISNFAKSGYESHHNMRYWEQKEYIGIGLGASSFMDGRRFSNDNDFRAYIKDCSEGGKPKLKEDILLSDKELMDEFMMLGFRKISGPSFEDFEEKFGKNPWNVYKEPLKKLINKGFLEERNGGVRLTDKGLDFANEVFEEFV